MNKQEILQLKFLSKHTIIRKMTKLDIGDYVLGIQWKELLTKYGYTEYDNQRIVTYTLNGKAIPVMEEQVRIIENNLYMISNVCNDYISIVAFEDLEKDTCQSIDNLPMTIFYPVSGKENAVSKAIVKSSKTIGSAIEISAPTKKSEDFDSCEFEDSPMAVTDDQELGRIEAETIMKANYERDYGGYTPMD